MSRATDLIKVAELITSAAQQTRYLAHELSIDTCPEIFDAVQQIETAATKLKQAGRRIERGDL